MLPFCITSGEGFQNPHLALAVLDESMPNWTVRISDPAACGLCRSEKPA